VKKLFYLDILILLFYL